MRRVLGALIVLCVGIPSSSAQTLTNKRCSAVIEFVRRVDKSWTPIVCKYKLATQSGVTLSQGTEVLFRNTAGGELFVVVGKGRFKRKASQTTEFNGIQVVSVQVPNSILESRSIDQTDLQNKLAKRFVRTGAP
jgi:hypothetical protein